MSRLGRLRVVWFGVPFKGKLTINSITSGEFADDGLHLYVDWEILIGPTRSIYLTGCHKFKSGFNPKNGDTNAWLVGAGNSSNIY
jgi:hypothetical protein